MMASPDASSNRSPLVESQIRLGANLVAFDGWQVPANYGDPDGECMQLHQRAGVIDLTPAGRIRARGDGAAALLGRLCTADVARQEDNTAQRSLLLSESGGVIDIVTVLRLDGWWVLKCTPCRREAVLEHLEAHADDFDAKIDDQTFKTVTLGVIGPKAAEILDRFLPEKVSGLGENEVRTGSMLIASYMAARTGETKLWSLEVTLPNMLAGQAWKYITSKAGDNALAPAGVDALEVLRIEARLPRWGNEVDEQTDPVSAGLGQWISKDKDFLGAHAVEKARLAHGHQGHPRRVAWAIEMANEAERTAGIAPGDNIFSMAQSEIGRVTSAVYSPAERTWLGQATGPANLLGDTSTFSILAGSGKTYFATVKEAF